MSRRLLAPAFAAALSLAAAATASAATEVGQPCTANGTEANRTLLVFTGNDNPLIQPVVPEEPDQVITGWKVQVGPGQAPMPQRLEVYRVLNEAQDYRKEAESATETVSEGVNYFPARIPIDSFTGYLALYGPDGAFVCNSTPGVAGSFEGAAAIGETRNVKSSAGLGVPLMAMIEDDRDGDGYGDLTQDRCPKSAAFQGDCPEVTLEVAAQARRGSIVVRVTASAEASVKVFGQVGWGYKPKPKGKARASRRGKHLIVALNGGTRTVLTGTTSSFTVPLPKQVKLRLSRLTPKESLSAKIVARSTDLAGRVRDTRLTVKLHGWKRGK